MSLSCWKPALLAALVAHVAGESALECARLAGSLTTEGDEFCTYDKIPIFWDAEVPNIAGTFAVWGIGLFDQESGNLIKRVRLHHDKLVNWEDQRMLVERGFESFVDKVPVIGCEVFSDLEKEREASCGYGQHFPAILSVIASPGYGVGSNFTIQFDRNTNTPDLSEDSSVRSIIEWSHPIGNKLRGVWVNPRTLIVHVDDDSGRADYHDVGTTVALVKRDRRPEERVFASVRDLQTITQPPLHLDGHVFVRLGFPSRVIAKLFLYDNEVPVAVSSGFHVRSCDANDENVEVVLQPAPEVATSSRPIWSIEDQLVLHNSKLILPRVSSSSSRGGEKVLSSQYDVFEPASWSLSFWIALGPPSGDETSCTKRNHVDASDGTFRALLYHGEGKGHETGLRTPSVWLFPRSNRLALRVSTPSDNDHGADSDIELPDETWVHVAMVFKNETGRFRASVYVDGDVAVKVDVTDQIVLGSRGQLHFAHDPWSPGPRGFVEELHLYDTALSRLEIQLEMQKSSRYGSRHTNGLFGVQLLGESKKLATLPCKDPVTSQELFEKAKASDSDSEKRELLEIAARDGHAASLLALQNLEHDRMGPNGLWYLNTAAQTRDPQALYARAILPEVELLLGGEIPVSQKPSFRSRLETAVLYGSVEAKVALANEMRLSGRCRAALFYMADAAEEALVEHTVGGQEPIVELQILSDFVEEAAERGEDDEHIQYQMVLAEQGDVEALTAVGGLYYWGARGMERDQAKAFRYFERAGNLGYAPGQTAAGNMLLKGEGVEAKNVSRAMEFYQRAADQDNLEALNGLGFIHFFGNDEVPKNVTKALEYFEQNLRDGDSLFNAAFIYLHEDDLRNVGQAKDYLAVAAANYASFNAAKMLGELLATSDTSSFGCTEALKYYRAAALRASWGKRLRAGFNAYLDRDLELSARRYTEAALLGYSRGAENALWLMHNKLGMDHVPFRELLGRMDTPIAPLHRLAEGDLYFKAGETEAAIQAWVAASVDGNWAHDQVYRAEASYNLGIYAMSLHEWGLAEQYFVRAEEFVQDNDSDPANAARVALRLARWRLTVTKYMGSWVSGVLESWL